MRSSRSSLFAAFGIALVSGLLTLGAGAVMPKTAQACPESGGACPCGDKCPTEHAGDCAKDSAGGCAGDCAKNGAPGGCDGKDAKAAACACPPGEGGNCACGAECGSKHGGKCDKVAADTGEKKAGGCGCSGPGAAAQPGATAAPCGAAAAEGAGAQRAVIDPTTGQLMVPDKAEAAAVAEAAPAQAQASAGDAAATARQLAVPGAGVMAPFPSDRASHAVANVNNAGKATMGCEHPAE